MEERVCLWGVISDVMNRSTQDYSP
jgi:hypothetical protein